MGGRIYPKVEKDVPLPLEDLERHRKNYGSLYGKAATRKPPYPFIEMEIGDSFLIPATRNIDTVRSSANRKGHQIGKRFYIGLDSEKNYRCWRIE